MDPAATAAAAAAAAPLADIPPATQTAPMTFNGSPAKPATAVKFLPTSPEQPTAAAADNDMMQPLERSPLNPELWRQRQRRPGSLTGSQADQTTAASAASAVAAAIADVTADQQQQQQPQSQQQQHDAQHQPQHQSLAADEEKYSSTQDARNDHSHWNMSVDQSTPQPQQQSQPPQPDPQQQQQQHQQPFVDKQNENDDTQSDTQSVYSLGPLNTSKLRIHRAGRSLHKGVAQKQVPLGKSLDQKHSNIDGVLSMVRARHGYRVGEGGRPDVDAGGDGRRIHRVARLLKPDKTIVASQHVAPGSQHQNVDAVTEAVRQRLVGRMHGGVAAGAGGPGPDYETQRAAAEQRAKEEQRLAVQQQQAAAEAARAQQLADAKQQGHHKPGFLARCLQTGPLAPCWAGLEHTPCLAGFTRAVNNALDSSGTATAAKELAGGVVVPAVFDSMAVTAALNRYPPDAVLATSVRRSDLLPADANVVHPVVKLHVVDANSGQYLAKSHLLRRSVAPHENDREDHMPYILPIMTQPYNLLQLGAFVPEWQEELVINEPLTHFFRPNVLLLFEILEFGPRVDLHAHPDGAYPVAWAFLKILSGKGAPNIGEMRLQLYRHSGKERPPMQRLNVPPVYFDWVWQKNTRRLEFPSSLFVHVAGVHPPDSRLVRGERPLLPTDEERGRIAFMDMRRKLREMEQDDDDDDDDALGDGDGDGAGGNDIDARARRRARRLSMHKRRAARRRRLAHADCRIPNQELHEINAGANGCFAVAYSPNGRMIAAACGERITFAIKLFDAESGGMLFTYAGHRDLVYDLSWSPDGTSLLSASSDNTARVWNTVETDIHPRAMATLQHTSYVYAAKMHPTARHPPLVLTGAYDGVVRVWNMDTRQVEVALTHHKTHVNALEMAPNGARFYTGDAHGNIKIWADNAVHGRIVHAPRAGDSVGDSSHGDRTLAMPWRERFRCVRTLAPAQFSGQIINSLKFCPHPERLVVYTRNNGLFIIDLIGHQVRKQMSVPCGNTRLGCALSPDGKLVVVGGDDGKAHFFDLYSGTRRGIVNLGYQLGVCAVSWHPTEHCVAFCSYGGNATVDYPMYVWEYDASAVETDTQKDTQLTSGERRRNSGGDGGVSARQVTFQ